jgi:fructose-1,6-bisphosphatase I
MAVNRRVLTLDEFTLQAFRQIPKATGELSALLRDIGLAAKRINVEVNKIGLVDMLGETGNVNIQGEEVKKMDVFANNQMIGVLKHGVSCAGIGSEELDEIVVFDTNVSIGTIFGVYKRKSELGKPCDKNDFLQPGVAQVAAGYVVYGSSTMLVYATRRGVNGFTLDPAIGEFCLSHPDIKCPGDGKIYSVNHGNFFKYDKAVQEYITCCQKKTEDDGGPYTNRYIGSMVADVHRTLIKGGIFMYPGTKNKPSGKLRLMYECNPFAFIIEVAGGKASNGTRRIVDVEPEHLHQRSTIFIGSKNMVDECLSYM